LAKPQLTNYQILPSATDANINTFTATNQKHIVFINTTNKYISDNQIDISNLRKGMYILKIENERGIVSKKFVK